MYAYLFINFPVNLSGYLLDQAHQMQHQRQQMDQVAEEFLKHLRNRNNHHHVTSSLALCSMLLQSNKHISNYAKNSCNV